MADLMGRERQMSRVISLGLIGVISLLPMPALASYYVYCANGRVEVDGRNPQQMRSARGSGICQMGAEFKYLSDAQSFAQRNFGGAGKPCSCR
jgi:hypothetical protein